jgi:hypothetical protein
MRSANLVQDLRCGVDEHWRLFLDEGFDRAQYLEALGFQGYEVLERVETEAEIMRRCRVTPPLDPKVKKWLGADFAYTEEGRFDRAGRIWRARTVPSRFADRVTQTSEVRVAATAAGRCRRTIQIDLDVRAAGFGGLIERAVLGSLRTGWEQAARFMDERLARGR